MSDAIITLRQAVNGEVILPEDASYEQVRNSFAVSGSPAVVVRPLSESDVALAIAYAQENDLLLSVRGGGHNAAGLSTNEGGLVIDLSKMNKVEIIDSAQHVVRVGGGATWGEVAAFLHEKGLALSSGDTNSVGVGGLTLGGGIGWMVRKYGLAIDSLIAAELVTADGRTLEVSTEKHPDLFWAIRGGGGNFGVVTHFTFVAHPVGKVFAGKITYTLDNLPELLKGWRDYMRTADENLTTTILIMPSFGGNPPALNLLCCYAGDDKAAATKAIDPLRQFGKVVQDDVAEKDYPDVLEDVPRPQGMRALVSNIIAKECSDELIQAIVAATGQQAPPILQIRSLGGAMARVPMDATAMAWRDCEIMLVGVSLLPPAAPPTAEQNALALWKTIAAFGSGAYTNFISTATAKDIAMIYPEETYRRLAKVKAQYDPQNVFNQNYNVKPSQG